MPNSEQSTSSRLLIHARITRHYLCGLCADCSHEAVDAPQSSCAPLLLRDMEPMCHDVVERGDDDDDAGRCRSDARARTRGRAAFAAEERG